MFGNKLNTKLDISKEYYLKINDKGPHFFVCHTCKIKLAKGRIPSMAAVNGLSLIEIPASKDINLTDLENNLVAQKILFQKIFQLPKSRIAAVKDKLVNIPIQESDIVNTLLSLPRTPMEGGLIEVRLKRKQIYKNYHRQEFINPEKLFRAIKFLKDSGNPFYQSFKNLSDYKKMCESEDPSGFQLLFGEEIKTQEVNSFPIKTRRCSVLFVDDNAQNWEEIMELKDYTNMMARELDEKEEIDYREKDSIRKYQIDYDESICLAENFPEAFYLENKKEIDQISVAPGEGKVPENLLSSENWDALAFPMKHPDGRNNLHHKRDVKLSDQYYFVQRLRNKDERFRSDPSYLFAASSYIEKKQLQRNINVSFLRGKKSKSATQEGNVYNLEDAFSVFDSTSNTPTYWKKAKYEMMAKLDNLGPFQFFFTLSCADKLWEENFTAILEERNIKIEYKFDSRHFTDNAEENKYSNKIRETGEISNSQNIKDLDDTEEDSECAENETQTCNDKENIRRTQVQREKDGKKEWISLEKYLEEETSQSLHEMLRRNVVTATRNYNHRVKTFIKQIITHPSNPMSIEYYSAKLEFQGRGAGHHHGTLWVNMEKMEFMMEGETRDERKSKVEYNIHDFHCLFDVNEQVFKKDVMDSLLKCKNNQQFKSEKEIMEEEKAKDVIILFGQRKLKLESVAEILSKFKFIGLTKAFKKFQTHEELLDFEETAVINFANRFTSVCLCPAIVGKEVVEIVRKVNRHGHSKSCRKYTTPCRFFFPKYPIWKTLISSPNKFVNEADAAKFNKILKDVKELLCDEEVIQKIMADFNKDEESKEEYLRNRELRIKRLLFMAGLKSEEDLELYTRALKSTRGGYNIIMERDIDEVFVNSYNPEWILAWNGNMDLQVCLDYFAVITYITEYYSKDDSGTMQILIDAMKNAECDSLKEKMALMMHTFLTHRQMGEAEAVYKLLPDFHFKDSNLSTIFFPNCPREDRSKFLMRVDDKPQFSHLPTVKIEGRDGVYIEKYDIISKYERRGENVLVLICPSHFMKMYEPSWKKPKETNNHKNKSKFHFVMSKDENQGEYLPDYLTLSNPYPNEPPYMKKRKFPAALRFHKINSKKNAEKYFFSECLLYTPFKKEEEIMARINSLNGDFTQLQNDIKKVKAQVMEHLESNEEARLFVEEALKNQETGDKMDAEGEQEKDDCEIDGQILHPDFEHLNPDDINIHEEKKVKDTQFRPIEIDSMKELLSKTRNLDFYQKKVVEKGINYARNLVKALKVKNSIPEPRCSIIMGGAGSGKSTVINVLKQWLHLILKKEGDNPEFPYVVVTAPTGTAASKVRGQTLHSAFGFNFGNKHFSLSDKKRDKTRTLLKNLKIIIVDEVSMVKSDLLYQLDLRLREITEKPTKLFGGVVIFYMGDIMQLRPCKGSFIFDEPKCKDYLLPFLCKTHWISFDVIFLEENHRQGGDHEYAEMLNRIRVGQQTTQDIDILKTRVRPEGHPDLCGAMYISCTNKSVNKMNDVRINELEAELFEIEALNIHPTIQNFKPKLEAKGTVGGTAFLQTLKIKVGARVMLIHNIDVLDGLSNGTRGELIAVENDSMKKITLLLIKFDEQYQGAQKRINNPGLSAKYPGCTPIKKYLCSYSLAKKTTIASNTAQVYQFPIVVCFAATTHKFQGGTVYKPNKVALDLRTVFDDAMTYVMLSRVEDLLQLFIIGSVPEEKFRTSSKCLTELERLENKSINKNPPTFEQTFQSCVKISVLNCHSLLDKILDIKSDKMLAFSHVICLTETWLKHDFYLEQDLQIKGYKLHLNSFGEQRAKGLAIYFKEDAFHVESAEKHLTIQVSKLSSDSMDIIVVYRSKNCHIGWEKISTKINHSKTTVVVGDFNVCYNENKSHPLVKKLLEFGFQQLVTQATHIEGGLIDHVYFRNGQQPMDIDVAMYSPYYTANDHDALCLTLKTLNDVSGRIISNHNNLFIN